MAVATGDREPSTTCTFHFFDCLPRRRDEERARCSGVPSIMRETNVTYQQPHLVEPMTLRVYEDLPSTPATHDTFQLPQWSKTLASRASSRASRISMKRRETFKSLISRPQPQPEQADDLPFRRRQQFSPLQLSIYKDSQRLSDLPEFDSLSFTEIGELKAPPKALMRTQSEDMLRSHHRAVTESPRRRASMYETSKSLAPRPGTASSIISTSRPPSEYDALHSHPVSLSSLPVISAPKSQKPDHMVAILTPMQEEFSPTPTAVSVDGTVLTFPKTVQLQSATVPLPTPSLESQAPYPVVSQGPSGTELNEQRNSTRRHVRNNSQTQKRVSQWLHYRSQSNSVSTIGSVSTTASFAEHRRRRVEFYKLGQQAYAPVAVPASPPQPLSFPSNRAFPLHQRTNTESSQQTVDTSGLSSTYDANSERLSQESMTTYSMAEVRSRAGTVKSVGSLRGPRIVAPAQRCSPASAAMMGTINAHKGLYLDEINGPLRSPGVGIAF